MPISAFEPVRDRLDDAQRVRVLTGFVMLQTMKTPVDPPPVSVTFGRPGFCSSLRRVDHSAPPPTAPRGRRAKRMRRSRTGGFLPRPRRVQRKRTGGGTTSDSAVTWKLNWNAMTPSRTSARGGLGNGAARLNAFIASTSSSSSPLDFCT